MIKIELVRADHAPALLAFERANREYFAASVPDRGDHFFTEYAERHAALLSRQEEGTDWFHVLLDGDAVVGRVNLVEANDGSAELGYRIAESATGRGLATWAVGEVVELARGYGLRELRAKTTADNLASRKVLTRAGFTETGELEISGAPGFGYVLAL
ncbi:hypothetical protein Afil01_45780 [Actinorhabdospora filicis]|uniref:N-acetyltransferase domain-containing protein n=1 Tax=Actinorhabdospora filicis TaxID=1785913 RepID=A0A9W6SPG6_9ACTN|nr:GNAT family N-acetyltransferase [Actinorhabdospora filicis]GLZ79771.1 hypothetical protein Afil01_45780 [Actinorhabdospora filicis]